MNKIPDFAPPSDHHEFAAYPGGRFPNACLRCGKPRDAPEHQIPPTTPPTTESEQDG